MEEKYLVSGEFDGELVREVVEAYSIKQARLKASFNLGLDNEKRKEFLRSNKIRVSRK